ncbi:MAG TPA: BlaI/MecI/CopY family transcriptional regulator [Polyangiaceae bacterium]|nr:BlaI/MecI/CopY family transcriptional regulator [Polyangiaceae bacterium]
MPTDEDPPILTRAESEIMTIIWDKGGATVHDVVAALPRSIAYTSVLTLLRILEKKGYVQHEAHPDGGRAHLYRPLVQAGNARRHHVRDLVDRLFGGQTEELVVGLLEEEKWSKGDLERLRELIDSRLGAGPASGKKGKGNAG